MKAGLICVCVVVERSPCALAPRTPLQRLGSGAQVDALLGLDLVCEPFDDPLVEVHPSNPVAARRAPRPRHRRRHRGRKTERPPEIEDEHRLGPSFRVRTRLCIRRSLMLRTSIPAILPASFVACRCASLSRRTVITARHLSPRLLRGVVRELAPQRRDLLFAYCFPADLEAHRVVRALDDLVA